MLATAARASRFPHLPPSVGRLSWLSLCVSAVLSACGGGGGDAGSAGSGVEVAQSSPQAQAQVVIDPLVDGSEAFHFTVDASLVDDAALQAAAGGSVYTAWDPTGSNELYAAGMKVTFFGQASACPSVSNGVVDAGADGDLLTAANATTTSANATGKLWRWSPSGATSGCSADAQQASGPSMVFLNPDSSHGGLALYTHSGPRSDGSSGLLAPFDASGQNGSGANAYITGSFVAFRQAWRSASAPHPWVGANQATDAVARVVATESVGRADVGSIVDVNQPVQVKQQVSVGFINTECMAGGSSAQRPCNVSYLFNTAIYRAGVDDWSTVAWFQQGKVWFDPAQGGTPIIEVPVAAAGQVVSDGDSGLALYQSKGNASQHASFAALDFDMRVSFDQLQNVLRIVAARKLGTTPSAVTDADLASLWGSRWNDRTAWVLLAATTGQEVRNPFATQQAEIGGQLSRLYVGPQS
jgi:hypothetical protein